ncbi:class I SAM-dependent methyltransferase [Cohnella cellulosilytica]|uniref:Class I SAM-dependent methyltransferase n=1 Tax=Cohnella cellulosilytica TaxID=986710 RepID=A0ABW2FJG2_9BACL
MINEYEGWKKFKDVNNDFFSYLDELQTMDIETKDFLYHFPVFVGYVNMSRFLFLYDLYKKVNELNGHIADVGTFKGATLLFFTKLVKLFENYTSTQVHGFDWFMGMNPDAGANSTYKGDYETLLKLIKLQKLEDISIVHKMDITKELRGYFEQHPYLRYKIVLIDCGIKEVLDSALEHFWPRLVPGGILIMDHYNAEVSKDESEIVEKYIGSNYVRQVSFSRSPTCYVVKEK